jgi:hypothetical protein
MNFELVKKKSFGDPGSQMRIHVITAAGKGFFYSPWYGFVEQISSWSKKKRLTGTRMRVAEVEPEPRP